MPETETIISAIRAEAARRGVKQKDIAEALQISAAGVSERLAGRTPIRVDELVKIAALLHIRVSDLISEEAVAS